MPRTIRRSPRTLFPALNASLPRRGIRRGFRPALSQLEDRALLATITWANDVSGDWDNPSMWTGGALPGPSDDAVISFSDITVTHDTSPSDAVDSVNCAATLDLSSGSLSIDTTSASQPTSTVSGQFNLSGASLQVLSGNVNLTGGGTISGSVAATAGTSLGLSGQVLTTSSVVSSDGSVTLVGCTEAGSYSAAGGTSASGTTFTGTVVNVGSSLLVGTNGTVSFAPSVGGPVTLTTGALTLNQGATLTGTDSFVVNGLLTLNPVSTLSTTGTVDAYGGISITTGLYYNYIDGTTLNNYAVATWQVTPGFYDLIYLNSGAVINNLAGATFTVTGQEGSDDLIVVQDNSAAAFNNAGTFIAATGVSVAAPFANSGSVIVQQDDGALFEGNGSTVSTGTFTAAAGTDLEIDDEMLAASSVVSSDGSVTLVGCTEAGSYSAAGGTSASGTTFTGTVVNVGSSLLVGTNGTVSFAPSVGGPVTLTTGALTLNQGATLTGTDSFVVNGLLTLNPVSTLSTTGTVDAYGGISITTGLYYNYIDGTTLNNYAVATWQVTPGFYDLIYLNSGAVINNLAGATFTVTGQEGSDDLIVVQDNSAAAFNNAGTFIAATGVSVAAPFANSGSVIVQQDDGALFEGNGSTVSTGTFTAAAGTDLEIDDEMLAASSVVSSDGSVTLVGCTEAGSYSAAGGTSASGTTFTGTVVNVGSSLLVGTNGTVSFAPSVGGPVTLTTGALTLNQGATLTGTDSFVVNGLLTLNPVSTLSTTGTVDAYGGISITTGLYYNYIDGTTLNNYAVATWQVTPGFYDLIYLNSGAVINNLAGATFTVTGQEGSDDLIVVQDNSAAAFNNAGTFIAATGVSVAAPFANSGSVIVQQDDGALFEGNGSTVSTGTFTAAAGTDLEIDDEMLAASSVVSSDGSVTLVGCTEAGSYTPRAAPPLRAPPSPAPWSTWAALCWLAPTAR